MLKKFCPHPNCKNIIGVSDRYCEQHLQTAIEREASRQKRYDINTRLTRDAKYHGFYLTSEWETMKLFIHNKFYGLCVYSYIVEHQTVNADMVHHIVPIKVDWNLKLVENNLIPLSSSVHNRIERAYKSDIDVMQKELYRATKEFIEKFNPQGRSEMF